MTVSSSVNKVIYSGNSATVLFPVNYYFLENSHLKVILRAADGTETVQALTTNYTVTGAGNPAGGSITMLVAPVTGTTLTIVRNVPATQETDYLANDPFPAESHERALDKLTMLTQENEEIASRSIQIPQTDPVSTNIIVPKVSDRASKLLGFDAVGSVAVSGSTIAQVDAAVATITSIASAPSGNSAGITHIAAGSGAVSTTVQAKLRESVSVKDFGAVGDGVADDTAAIQAAFDSLDPVLGGDLFFPPGRYRITATINLPITTSGTGRYEISGYGANIETSQDIVMFLRTVASNSIALNVIGDRFTVAGLSLSGSNPPSANSWGFKFGASYTSVFKDLNFVNLNTGLDLLFALNTIVDGCMATLCREYGFRARNGDWAGVSSANSQSNVTAFRNCRVFARAGAIAGFKIEGASGITLHNCISEGFTQQYGIFYDSLLSTVAKQLYIYNLHTEGSFTNAAVRIRGGGGQHVIDGWFHQGVMFGVPLLDATGGNSNSEYIIQNSPSPSELTNLISCDVGGRFSFVNLQWGKMYLSTKWIGGVLPTFLSEQRIGDPATEIGGQLYYAANTLIKSDSISIESSGGFALSALPSAVRTNLLQVATTGGDVTRYLALRNIAGTETHYVPAYDSVPNSADFLAPSRSAANIADITNAINTTKKYRGKQVYDTTNNRVMVASGSTAGANWYIVDGSAFVTPT